MSAQPEPAGVARKPGAIRRVAVVMNGRAGALLDGAQLPALEAAFAAAGIAPNFIPAEAGTLSQRMELAANADVDAVVVAGGDGTIACAALVMAGRELPLAILPFGTMNLLAKDLGLPIGDPAAGIAAIAGGHVRSIDVGDVNGRVFLCASMLGLPARIGRTREQTRGAGFHAIARMASAVWRELLRARRLRVTLVADGSRIPLDAAALTITVNPVDPASGRTFGRPVLDGGRLGIYVIERLGPRAVLGLAARLLLGRHNAALDERLAGSVDITRPRHGRRRGRPPAMRVMNDGEMALIAPPLRYRIKPRALRVLVPNSGFR